MALLGLCLELSFNVAIARPMEKHSVINVTADLRLVLVYSWVE